MTRLINADALEAEMYHKSFEVDDGRNVWNSGLWIRYKIFEEAIRDAPTVDADPVRHGKWIDGHCSLCGCDAPAYIEDWKWIKDMNAKYCPMCGARMDEEYCSKGEV